MKQFKYKAVTNDGRKIEGLIESNSREMAVNTLREKGLIVIDIIDPESGLGYQFNLRFSKISNNELVYFTRQFAAMVGSGLSIINALNIIKQKSKPAMAKLLNDISNDLEAGESLHSAFSHHPKVFSSIYLSLVKAAEVAGMLDKVMDNLAKNLEQQREFRAKVKSSLMYPIIILVAMLGAGIVMVFFVMPQLQSMYKEFDAELPMITSVIFGMVDFLRAYWYVVFGAIAGVVFAAFSWLKTPSGKATFDKKSLEIPYLGPLQHKIIGADMIRTLAMLIKAGVSLVESLEVSANVTNNTVYREGMHQVIEDVKKGIPLATALARANFLPDMIIQMIAVGEETGKMDEMLSKVAEQFRKDSLMALKALTSAIEPALIVVLGIGVGVIVFAVIMPMYNLTSQF